MIVVDASVAVKWCVAEAGHDSADRLLAGRPDMIAPDRLLLEAANTLLRKRQRGEIGQLQASAALERLATLLVDIIPSQAIVAQAFSLAFAMIHQIYDCTYLALAIARNCPLITADTTFAAKAVSAGHRHHLITIADGVSSST